MTDTIDAALVTAVEKAIDQPVNYVTISQAICRSQNGGGKCICERNRFWKHCHSAELYGDMSIAVLSLLKRAGMIRP